MPMHAALRFSRSGESVHAEIHSPEATLRIRFDAPLS